MRAVSPVFRSAPCVYAGACSIGAGAGACTATAFGGAERSPTIARKSNFPFCSSCSRACCSSCRRRSMICCCCSDCSLVVIIEIRFFSTCFSSRLRFSCFSLSAAAVASASSLSFAKRSAYISSNFPLFACHSASHPPSKWQVNSGGSSPACTTIIGVPTLVSVPASCACLLLP